MIEHGEFLRVFWKTMDAMEEKNSFHDKMTEKYGSIWWKSDATIEEKNEYDRLFDEWNKYSAISMDLKRRR